MPKETNKGNSSNNHGPGAMGNFEKPKDFKGTMKNLLKYLKPYRLLIILIFFLAIGSAIFTIVGPKIIGNITTDIFTGIIAKISNKGGIDFESIKKTSFILIGLYVVSMIFSVIQGFITSKISTKISYNLRKEISEKINRLPMKYFDKYTHGEVLSKITNDVDTLSQSLNQSMSQIITSVILAVGILVMMITISIPLTIATLLILPLSFASMGVIIKNSQKHFTKQQEYLGHINGIVEEVYGGHDIVTSFNGEKKAIDDFSNINDTLYTSAWKSQFLSGIMYPIIIFIGNLGYVIVSIYGGYLAVKNKIQVGDILSFTQYVRTFNQSISQLAQIMNLLQSTAAAAERVFGFLEEKEEVIEVEVSPTIENSGDISFNHVTFGYNSKKTIINDFTIDVKKGQRVAIVGPTGAGKSTIIKLLMRFYDVNKGEITLDGHNIKDYKRSDLRRNFGMVLQDTWLFNGTILDNIRYGNLKATDSEVKSAAKIAGVDHFIKTLPDDYHMILNEEADNISEGQKQLLTIARVILADPKILILDEATSSVDTRTEILIQEAMDKLMVGRTSFIIAHRLSTIKNADIILVMKDGDIVETGNHENLLKQNGFYAKLYNSQFEE